ncbi:uncharacterized protein LOC116218516 [Clupea harengus]|uniref:Uncharacterized protein LOC116218516 n=1 Tax=Clupea harengus TaxID=7950 RepID=A0A6P8EW65_CLUHA|nr:uncharacterized protein LOC116218516 [Clupea harengus]
MHSTGIQSLSPISAISDSESEEYYLEDFFLEDRPSSESNSFTRALTPDSPVPQFNMSTVPAIQWNRSASPHSATSDIEYFDTNWNYEQVPYEVRPESPLSGSDEAFKNVVGECVMALRPLSPDSLSSESDYKLSFLEHWLKELRPSSPGSHTSLEFRPLSPDSPIPQYANYLPQNMLTGAVKSDLGPSPVPTLSDNESCFSWDYDEGRPQSPDSIIDESSRHPISPDAAGFVIRKNFPNSREPYDTSLKRGPGSKSLESQMGPPVKIMALESVGAVSADISFPKKFRLVYETVPCKLMSHMYDPPFKGEHLCTKAGIFERILDTERTTERDETDECSDQIQMSEEVQATIVVAETSSDFTSKMIPEVLSVQLSSLKSEIMICRHDELISTLPLQSSESGQLGKQYAFTSDSESLLSKSSSVYRSPSCQSVISDSDGALLSVEDLFVDIRPSSPESFTSVDESRPLSVDSPVPQYENFLDTYMLSFNEYPSSPPESVSSEIEYSELGIEELFSETRPDSPQSQPPDYESENRSLSPDSLSASEDYAEEFLEWCQLFRPPSPESLAELNEFRALSPDSPVPQYKCPLAVSITHSAHLRSTSPASLTSENTEEELYLDFFTERRPMSPESPIPEYIHSTCDQLICSTSRSSSPVSLASDIEYSDLYLEELFQEGRIDSPEPLCLCDEGRFLSPDSPIPDYGNVKFETSIYTGSRSSSPTSPILDIEYSELCLNELFNEDRTWCPDSSYSPDACRPLSPDSPIPEYGCQTFELLNFTGKRSSSPVSLASDVEYSDLCLAELFDEDRPDSPESVILDDETTSKYLTKYRPLTPESLISETDYCLFFSKWLEEVRAFSPESISSLDEYRPLSPDSPVPQYEIPLTISMHSTGIQSLSPISAISDSESEEYYLEDFFLEDRPSSESNSFTRALTPDSPVPQFNMSTVPAIQWNRSASPHSATSDIEYFDTNWNYEQVPYEVRPESPLSGSDEAFKNVVGECVMALRPLSPDSLSSESDYKLSFLEHWLKELRPSSPGSHTSLEFRPLSPDSPIPQYANYLPQNMLTGAVKSDLGPSPVPTLSDNESCFSWDYDEGRPQSPDSIIDESSHHPISPDAAGFVICKNFPNSGEPYDTSLKRGPGSKSLESQMGPPVKIMALESVGAVSADISFPKKFRLVYETVPCKLMSHMYDPPFKGEHLCTKAGIFERILDTERTTERDETDECSDQIQMSEEVQATIVVAETSSDFTSKMIPEVLSVQLSSLKSGI